MGDTVYDRHQTDRPAMQEPRIQADGDFCPVPNY